MNKALSVLPNFTILAEVRHPDYFKKLMGILRCFCEVISSVEHIDTYRITPQSFWKGKNLLDKDFIEIIKENSKNEVPLNVVEELKKFDDKFNTVKSIGRDCLLIKNENLLEEVKNHSKIKSNIYNSEGNIIFIENMDLRELTEIFESEFGYPIQRHESRINVYFIEIEDKEAERKSYAVEAVNGLEAFKKLYGKCNLFNEKDARKKLRINKKEFTPEAISEYMEFYYNCKNRTAPFVKVSEVPSNHLLDPVII